MKRSLHLSLLWSINLFLENSAHFLKHEKKNSLLEQDLLKTSVSFSLYSKYFSRTDYQNGSHLNEKLLARYCKNLMPRSCEHSLLERSSSRPCSLSESFLSTKNALTLEMKGFESTALR